MSTECYNSAMAARLTCPTQSIPNFQRRHKTSSVACRSSIVIKSQSTTSDEDEQPQYWKKVSRKANRPYRPLIKLSASDGRYQGEWTSEYALMLSQLRLSDLVAQDGGERDADVFIGFSVQKHAGFGFSIEGRVRTCFTSICSSCFCSYHREVIYVKPGSEADLDSLIRDTIRLTASAKDTCSKACERSAPMWQYTDGKKTYDKRWSKLLQIKKGV